MNDNDRQGVINCIEWLEEEAELEVREKAKKDKEELLKSNLKHINNKWTAIAEMYKSVEQIGEDPCKIGVAIGKTEICYKLKYISPKIYHELMKYLQKKEREQKDYKIMYEDLLQLYNYEVEQVKHWRSQWKEAEDESGIYFE